MSPIEIALRLVGGLFLVTANAFFVVTEFAVTRLPQLDPADDPPGMETARRITDQLEIYLTGCQLGITSSSIVLGVVAEPAVTYLLMPLFTFAGISGGLAHTVSVVVGIVIINLIHKIWGEQVPTYLGVERPRQIARHTARALEVWTIVVYPLIMFGDGLAKWTLGLFGVEMERSWTEEEGDEEELLIGPGAVRREIGDVLSRANLSRERSYEILRAVEIENIPVRRITVPYSEMVALHASDDLSESLQRMRAHPHDRYPLLGDDETDIVGILYMTNVFRHLPELERGDAHLTDIAEPVVWVDPELPISDLIDRFQSEQQEIAIVHDDGRIHGLVTATDAFEAITGELEDPEDVDRRETANQTATSSAQHASTTGRPGEG